MEILEAIKKRHSVRRYQDKALDADTISKLNTFIQECNTKSGLHIQLCVNEPKAFESKLAHYGTFRNVKNYIAVVGLDTPYLQEKCGYYGEKIVLYMTQLGLQSCWAALTYSKRKCACRIDRGEKLVCVIALGYGETEGSPHKVKPLGKLFRTDNKEIPEWFKRGLKAAQLAPTAVNQQKFLFTLSGRTVSAKALTGFYTKLDLGIVKYHFEAGAGEGSFEWDKDSQPPV